MSGPGAGPEELAVRIPGLRLAALAWGPPDGLPVLALHGWLDNAASFSRLAPLLQGCRVLALEFPGHGHSDHRPAGARYHFIDYVADTLAALDALGWTRCTLLGHSLGGAVASILAGACPERVERLALVEALGPMPARAGEAPAQFAEHCKRARALDSSRAPRYDSLREAVDRRVRATGMSTAAALPIVERAVRAADDGGVAWRSDPRLTLPSLQRLAESQVLEYLSAIEADTLLLAVDGHGRPFGRGVLGERMRRVRRLQLLTLGGSHHLHLDDAPSAARALVPFLQGEAARPENC